MDEKLKKNSLGSLNIPGRWTYLFAAAMMVTTPMFTYANGEQNLNEAKVAAVQQAKKSINGIVLDANGEPIVGATVVEKGVANNGTITNLDGKFTLTVKTGAQITVSYVGYKSQTLAVKGNSVTIRLESDQEILDEVVVVAYGTQKKKDLTGSMTSVKAENIAVQNTTTISRALEGSAPGIQVASVDGQPGYDMGIRVRGMSSANGNSACALIVVDGVAQQANSDTENPLSRLNPEDIANITVLKDAASTALYGSRGANGVILITTKSGQSGKARISFEARWGWNSAGPYDNNSMEDASQVYEYAWRSIYNSYRYGVNGTGLPGIDANGYYYSNVNNPNHTHEEAALFASQHLFDYTGSETNFSKNSLGNYMAYRVPGAIYTSTGSGNNTSATMSGAYLIDPATGCINPKAQLIYKETMEDLMLRNAFRQQYNISASGGTDKMHYYYSLGYQDDPSYLRGTSYRRISGRANMDAMITSWLKVGANVGYANTEMRAMAGRWGTRNAGAASGNSFNYIRGWNPCISYYQYDQDGNRVIDPATGKYVLNFGDHRTYSPLSQSQMDDGNPWGRDLVWEIDTHFDQQNISEWTARTFAEVDFLKYFKFRLNFNMDEYNFRRLKYMNSIAGRGAPQGGMSLWTFFRRTINTQQLLTYSQDINKVHHVDAMAGHEYEDLNKKDVNFGSAYELIPGYVIPGNFVSRYSNIAGAVANPGWSLNTYRTESYFGRANYNYKERYYFSTSVRRDGASKYRKDKRWGTFWSVGGGWRFSEESFMKSLTWLDNAKIRISYGVTGNQNGVTSWYTNSTWSYGVATWQTSTSGTGVPATFKINAPGTPPNDDITWENIHQFDLGLDFSVLNSRITGAVDFYNNVTVNSLFAQAVSPLANLGAQSRTRNAAKIRNRGIEIELDADIIRTKDWTWSVGTNGTHYRTVLTSVPAEQIPYWDKTMDLPQGCWEATNESWKSTGTGDTNNRGVLYLRGEGRDYFNLYIFRFAGIDENSGMPMYWHRVTYYDVNPKADGTYDHDGRYAQYKQGDNVRTNVTADASRYEMGSVTPDWIGGFTTNLRYKDFDLGINIAYQLGGKFLSVDYANELYRGSAVSIGKGDQPLSKDLIGNTWSPTNRGAEFPMQWFTNGSRSMFYDGSTIGSYMWTDMALFDASYLRVKNITLGYTLPKALLRKVGVNKFRAFISCDNMFFISKKKGVDSSMSIVGGMEVGARSYPQMQTVTLGVNLEL